MGYLAVWKVLESIILEFRQKRLVIPKNIIENLRRTRSLISVLNADSKRRDTAEKIEENIESLEAYLISEGRKFFSSEHVDGWLKKLIEARKASDEEEESRFIPGLPRKEKWIRVKPSNELPFEKIKELASESNLSYKLQKDGYLLVYGGEEAIKDFVKKMATIYRLKVKK